MAQRDVSFVVTTFRISVSELIEGIIFLRCHNTLSAGVFNHSGHVRLQKVSNAQLGRIHTSLSGSFDPPRQRSSTTVAAQPLSCRFIWRQTAPRGFSVYSLWRKATIFIVRTCSIMQTSKPHGSCLILGFVEDGIILLHSFIPLLPSLLLSCRVIYFMKLSVAFSCGKTDERQPISPHSSITLSLMLA
jgi:hypothetical protein